jgi:alanyl-tRNA synthetase
VSSIRKSFVRYFVENKHAHLPSASLIPHRDPSILFTNAGTLQSSATHYSCSPSSAATVASAAILSHAQRKLS